MNFSYLAHKAASALAVILAVSILVFFMIHLVPGDPVDVMLGESASVTDKQAFREALGLNKPVLQQLQVFLAGLLTLDLGNSIQSNMPVSKMLSDAIPATMLLSLSAMAIALIIALPVGIFAAFKANRGPDNFAMLFSMLGMAIPNFLLGPLLVLFFSIWLGLLPVSGYQGMQHLLLPSLTLGFSMAAILSRMIRSSLLDVLSEDYIRTAQAKGAGAFQIAWRHALRNAWLPVITVIGTQFGALLGGAVVTEIIFDWPGLGALMIDSIHKRDYPVVQGCILVVSVFYILVNTTTDILYTALDPRIRYSQ